MRLTAQTTTPEGSSTATARDQIPIEVAPGAASSTAKVAGGGHFPRPLRAPTEPSSTERTSHTQHLRRMHTPPNIKKQSKQQQARKGAAPQQQPR